MMGAIRFSNAATPFVENLSFRFLSGKESTRYFCPFAIVSTAFFAIQITRRFVIDRPRSEETTGSQQREKPLRVPGKCHQYAHVADGEVSRPLQLVVSIANGGWEDGHLLRIGQALHPENGPARIDFDAPH